MLATSIFSFSGLSRNTSRHRSGLCQGYRLLSLSILFLLATTSLANTPGLPFTEAFEDEDLKDSATTAADGPCLLVLVSGRNDDRQCSRFRASNACAGAGRP